VFTRDHRQGPQLIIGKRETFGELAEANTMALAISLEQGEQSVTDLLPNTAEHRVRGVGKPTKHQTGNTTRINLLTGELLVRAQPERAISFKNT
jgi:hypothetical protein